MAKKKAHPGQPLSLVTSDCWLWTGAKQSAGYGTVWFQGRAWLVHRLAFLLAYDFLPDVLDHMCNERTCYRPDHLRPTTHRQNIARGSTPSAVAVRTNTCQRGHVGQWRTNGPGKRTCRVCANDRRRLRGEETSRV